MIFSKYISLRKMWLNGEGKVVTMYYSMYRRWKKGQSRQQTSHPSVPTYQRELYPNVFLEQPYQIGTETPQQLAYPLRTNSQDQAQGNNAYDPYSMDPQPLTSLPQVNAATIPLLRKFQTHLLPGQNSHPAMVVVVVVVVDL